MTNDDLCYLSASEALKLYKRRKLSPVELTKALIARAEKVNPKINCLADRYFDEAIAQAKASEARYMKRGTKTGALDGVPLAVKDAQRLKGKRTTQGSLIFKDWVDEHPGAHHHAGVLPLRHHRLAHLGCDAQSVEHRVGSRRIIGRIGRGIGGRDHHAGDGHRHGRVDPHSGGGLRCGWLQAAAWAEPGRSARQLRPLQPLRADDPHRGGRGADAERDLGPAPA